MRRLWLGLLFADLASLDSLTELVVNFSLAPAREQQGLAAPRPDEGDSFLFRDIGVDAHGTLFREMRAHEPVLSAAHFRPVMNGLLLFRWLFPRAGLSPISELLSVPGYAFLQESERMAYRTYEEFRYLVSGLLGVEVSAPLHHGIEPYSRDPNPQGLADLRSAQELLARAVGPPEDFGDYRRLDFGFAALDLEVADQIDTALRRDVHQRLVWLGDFEEGRPDSDSTEIDLSELITFDRGVLAAIVPESLSGLVAMDFAESLRLDRAAGRCFRCGQAMLLTAQQAARGSRGERVFHRECHLEHRREYYRRYHAGRALES
jgi:hypothetical protein